MLKKSMNEICQMLDIQKEVIEEVMKFDETFQFDMIETFFKELSSSDTREHALQKVKETLGEDEKGFKILACMLHWLSTTHSMYTENGIPEHIFIDTMKCFPRFIEEHYNSFGYYAFDRDFWTVRQVSMQLFRIGELEYEFASVDGEDVISLHIPSDVVLKEEKCRDSFEQARNFFETYYPDAASRRYVCKSWLMSPALKELLPEESNIIKFQKKFDIISWEKQSDEFLQWVFKRKDLPTEQLPEENSLQSNIKRHILAGGSIGDAYGVLV